MPRTPLAAAALLLLALAAARAQTPAPPATREPRSGRWGMDYREKIQATFARLLAASGYDAPASLAKDQRGPTELRFYEGGRMLGGSPAVALAARTGPNAQDHAVVVVTYGALEIGDEDHLAFFLAHEIAHLVHGHPQLVQKAQMALFDEWYDANSARLQGLSAEDAARLFAKEKGPQVQALAKPYEREADADGLSLMTLAGYDPKAAGEAMSRAQDWLWALSLPADDPAHDPLAQRAATLKRYAGQLDAGRRAGERAAGVLGAKPN